MFGDDRGFRNYHSSKGCAVAHSHHSPDSTPAGRCASIKGQPVSRDSTVHTLHLSLSIHSSASGAKAAAQQRRRDRNGVRDYVPLHVRVRERGPPRQAVRPGLRRRPGRVPCPGSRQQGRLRDLHQDQHGDGAGRDHHQGHRRLREDRARHLPQHRLRLRRRRPRRRPLQGAGQHRAAVPRHRPGRPRPLHQAPRGGRRRRPGDHVRLRHRRDPRADAPQPRACHQDRRPPHRGAQERHLRLGQARRQDPGHRRVPQRRRRHGPHPRPHRPHLHPARRDRHQRRDRRRPQGARHQAGHPRQVPRREHHLPPQPVRPLRHRRAPRRRRTHRPQDHHRHLRWLGSPRRRRVLRQGPHQGGPQRRLHCQAGRQEHRRERPRAPRHRADLLRHRCAGAPVCVRGHLRHRQDPRQGDPQAGEGELRLQARDDQHQPRPQEGWQQVHQDRCLRPFRPRRPRLHLGGGEAPQVPQGICIRSASHSGCSTGTQTSPAPRGNHNYVWRQVFLLVWSFHIYVLFYLSDFLLCLHNNKIFPMCRKNHLHNNMIYWSSIFF